MTFSKNEALLQEIAALEQHIDYLIHQSADEVAWASVNTHWDALSVDKATYDGPSVRDAWLAMCNRSSTWLHPRSCECFNAEVAMLFLKVLSESLIVTYRYELAVRIRQVQIAVEGLAALGQALVDYPDLTNHAGILFEHLRLHANTGHTSGEIGQTTSALAIERAGLVIAEKALQQSRTLVGQSTLLEVLLNLYVHAGIHAAEIEDSSVALALERSGLAVAAETLQRYPSLAGQAGIFDQFLRLYANAGLHAADVETPAAALAIETAGLAVAEEILHQYPTLVGQAGILEKQLYLYYNVGVYLEATDNLTEALAIERAGLATAAEALQKNPILLGKSGILEAQLRLYVHAGVHAAIIEAPATAFLIEQAGLAFTKATLLQNPDLVSQAGIVEHFLRLFVNAGINAGKVEHPIAALAIERAGLAFVETALQRNPSLVVHTGIIENQLNLYLNAGFSAVEFNDRVTALEIFRTGLSVTEKTLQNMPSLARHTGIVERQLRFYNNLGLSAEICEGLTSGFEIYQRGILAAQSAFIKISRKIANAEGLHKLHINLSKYYQVWCLWFRRCAFSAFAERDLANEWLLIERQGEYSLVQAAPFQNASPANEFSKFLRDWVVNWRPVDDDLGINGRLLDSCRVLEALWLLDHTHFQSALHQILKRIAVIQQPFDAWRHQSGIERSILQSKLVRAARHLDLDQPLQPESILAVLSRRTGLWSRWRDRSIKKALNRFEALNSFPPPISSQQLADWHATRHALARWLANAWLNKLGLTDQIQSETLALLALIYSDAERLELPNPNDWRTANDLDCFMASSGWERWSLHDDGFRATLAGWSSRTGRLRPNIAFELQNTAPVTLDQALRRYAVALATRLENDAALVASLPADYVQRIQVQIERAERWPESPTKPAAQAGEQIKDLAELFTQGWLEARQIAERLEPALAKVAAIDASPTPVSEKPDLWRAILSGRWLDWLSQQFETWLTEQVPLSAQPNLADGAVVIKRYFSLSLHQHPGIESNAELSRRLHGYCLRYLTQCLSNAQPDLAGIWETLERGRLALTGLHCRPLNDSVNSELGKVLHAKIHEITSREGGDLFTPLLHTWLDELNRQGVLPNHPDVDTCQKALQHDQALVQLFFNPIDRQLLSLWLDRQGLTLRTFPEFVSSECENNGDALKACVLRWQHWRLETKSRPQAFTALWHGLTQPNSAPRMVLDTFREWSCQTQVKRIVLLPDAQLAQLPWEGLLDESYSEIPFTIERAVSLTHWLRPLHKTGQSRNGAVVFGDDVTNPIKHGRDEVAHAANFFRNGIHLAPVEQMDGQQSTAFDVLRSLQQGAASHWVMHGLYNPWEPNRSAVTLFRDETREEKLLCWALGNVQNQQHFIALSACESALCGHTDEPLLGPVGIGQILVAGGAYQILGTLWKVDQAASVLLQRFLYDLATQASEQNDWHDLIRTAQRRLKDLSYEDAKALLPETDLNNNLTAPGDDPIAAKPFAHPYYWAPFVLLGRPDIPKRVD